MLSITLVSLLIHTLSLAQQTSDTYTIDDVHDALTSATPLVRCIVRAETGGTYNPYALGAQGERGIAQLHPRGKLLTFYAQGYTNPNNPWQAIEFLEAQLRQGQGNAWTVYDSCVR